MSLEKDWGFYLKSKDPVRRQKLLSEYLPLVKSVAGRMAIGFPRSVEIQDLISTGVIGLVEAFSNFDPTRGVKFETYAVPRIRGAILDELRSLDWVPRSTRSKSREIDKAMTKLENKLGRTPTAKELSKSLRIPIEELHSARGDLSSSIVLSLDDLVYKEDDNRQIPRIETIEDDSCNNILSDLEKKEMKSYLVSSIKDLSEQERLVIALYYYEELTLKEIGEVMEISESRVSQIHTKAVLKLRNMIKDKFIHKL
ncbi:MAG: FliA/WhiG family RNA polymerase sigma factor [candidate division Zixibacteria bacterium]|nr:FliA/WhiG family RNA polymerase sigma factor [candidate division Zixibacteria bacterium]